jgi:hypothetical protein
MVKAQTAGNTLLSDGEIELMRKRGLANPMEDLRRDLVRHPELIPFRTTHGQFIFFPENAVLLPGSWVCAYFEDGMNGGYVLLSYEVLPGGKIVWHRLDSRLND